MNRRLAWPLGAALAFTLASLQFCTYTLDDSAITLRYAYNLAHHGQLSFNVDDRVYGTTSILWALLCTPLMLADDPAVGLWLCKALSCALLALAVFVFAQLAAPMRAGRYVFLGCALLSVPFGAFAWSAMEFGLGLLLLAWFFRCWWREEKPVRTMALLAALIAFTRPDYAALTAPALGYELWRAAGQRRLLALAPGVTVAAMGLLGLAWYYGDPVPLPFYAKVLAPARDPGLHRGLRHLLLWWSVQGGWLVVPGLIAFASSTAQRARVARLLRVDAGRLSVALLACLLLFLFYASRGGKIVMDNSGRYYAPFLTIFALVAAASLEAWVTEHRPFLTRHLYALGAFACVFALGAQTVVWRLDGELRTRGRSKPLAAYAADMNGTYIPMGKYIHEHYSEDARLMLHDAGMVPLFSRAHVLDVWSLNNLEIVKCRGECRGAVASSYKPNLVLQDDKLLPAQTKLQPVFETGPTAPGRRKLTLLQAQWPDEATAPGRP